MLCLVGLRVRQKNKNKIKNVGKTKKNVEKRKNVTKIKKNVENVF